MGKTGAAGDGRTILIVCTANQCRSAMAEGLVKARLAREGRSGIQVGSAGTWAHPGAPATADAVAVMAERGIDISAHRAREATRALVGEADLVLAMTASHRDALVAESGPGVTTMRLFSELAGVRYDILDPVGQGLDTYRATADELERLIDAGWRKIAESPGSD